MRPASIVFVVLVALLVAVPPLTPPANATAVIPVRDVDLIRSASAIVIGTITSARSEWDGLRRQVFTEVTVDVERALKGSLRPGPWTVRVPGGRLGSLEVSVEGTPEFEPGEAVLLFLRQRRDGTLSVLHLYQGKFSLITNPWTGERWAVPPPAADVHVIGGVNAAASQRGRRLEDFERLIRANGGSSGEASTPTDTSGGGTGNFTYLGAPSRWFEPDDGVPVTMMLNEKGEPRAPTSGFSQVRDGMAAWNAVSGSTFRYRDGGFTSNVGWAFDGVNTVVFGDPLGQIDPPSGCGGVLALTVFFRDTGQTRVVNGQSFYRIIESDVVFADGWDGCGFYEVYANIAEVATHELGHVLGLGHSSISSATMYAYAHFDGRGATVTPDDAAGVRSSYPTPSSLSVSFTAPANGATVSGTTTVSLSASGGSGLTYRIAVDGTTISTGASPQVSWNTGTVPNGSHTLTATVTDASGQMATTSITVTVSNATAASFTASITYPGAGATVKGNQSIGMSTTATWGKSKTFTLSVDDQVVTSQLITGTTLWYTLDTTRIPDGARTLTLAVSYNGATATAARSITIANGTTPPAPGPLTASFTSPAGGTTVSGTVTVGMSSAGGASGPRTFTVSFSGPSSIPAVTITTSGTTASFAWNTTTATNGSYTLSLTLTDSAGATASATRAVTVSNGTTPPPPPTSGFTASITYPANNATVGGNQSVGMSTSASWGTAKTWTLSVDGRVLTTQSVSTGSTLWYTWNTTGVANGTHTLTLTVTTAGGTAGSSIAVTVKN